jgi:hypothetical protein
VAYRANAPGCECCDDCELPECSLSGAKTVGGGQWDVTLTWSVTGTGITRAWIQDNLGEYEFELDVTDTGGSGTIDIPGGYCKQWVLYVVNECGTRACGWFVPPELCECQHCTFESTGGDPITRAEIADFCMPCGCKRGRGTQIVTVISGIAAHYSGYHICTSGAGVMPCRPIPYGVTCYSEHIGFDILNGTHIFDLSNAPCEECGRFNCNLNPSWKILGTATVIDRYVSFCDRDDGDGFPTPIVTTYEIELGLRVVAVNSPGASDGGTLIPNTQPVATTGPQRECFTLFDQGGHGQYMAQPVYRRISPTLGTWTDFPFGPAATPADPCGRKYTSDLTFKVPSGGLTDFCCSAIDRALPELLSPGGFGDSLVQYIMRHGALESHVVTDGDP